jgi:hypothetical protein
MKVGVALHAAATDSARKSRLDTPEGADCVRMGRGGAIACVVL